ncbi:MAG: ATP-binding cassette domain-containing protein, partial [Pseudomonadota bacterium]
MNDAVIRCQHLAKIYTEGPAAVEVLADVSLEVMPGERLAIIGSSGSGKSTLLHLLGGLDTPTRGEVWVDGADMGKLDDVAR